MQAEKPLDGFFGDVLVLSGDVPLLSGSTVDQLIAYHRSEPTTATILTAILPDPTGYGRILRTEPEGVTESSNIRMRPKINAAFEINTGIYVFDKRSSSTACSTTPNNIQKSTI
jgi:bifunctional UDP-N-acetylglucosamine pyrophosphorylase/glucosamine-1-phosphate N-acetyltransferase